eukprot:6844500-Pyramimonas_sp.AAC.1
MEVEVGHALRCASMDDLEVQLVEPHAARVAVAASLGRAEHETVGLLSLCPLPRDVQLLEVYVLASSAQLLSLGRNAKQRGISRGSPRNVEQDVPTRLHQVEFLPVDVLQVRVPLRCNARNLTPERESGGRAVAGRRSTNRHLAAAQQKITTGLLSIQIPII